MSKPEFSDGVVRAISYIEGMKVAARLEAVYCLCQGLAIIFGGPQRFHEAGYEFAEAVPGAPEVWGWAILLCGLLMVYGLARMSDFISSLSMLLAGLWAIAFGTSFLLSAIDDPHGNLTAIFSYALQAGLFMVGAVVFHQAHSRRERKN